METVWSWLQVFVIAATPVLELRGAIPYGLFVLKLSLFETVLFSLLGNFFPVYFIIKFLPHLVNFLFKHSPFLHKYAQKYFERLHTKHSKRFDEIGGLALATFVAIPLPLTGAWSGAILAYLFNIRKPIALASIALGILGAGIIVAFLSGAIQFTWTDFLKK